MPVQDFILVIETLFCMAVLVWFFSRPWQSLWTAVSRQHLFELRDQLFDIAVEKRIEFSDPVYRQLRSYLNGCIRFAHKITFGTFVVGIMSLGAHTRKNYHLPEDIERVADESVRREMQDIFHKSVLVLLGHMAIRSPFLWIFVWFFLLVAAFSFVNNKISDMGEWVFSHFKGLVLAQADFDSSLKPSSHRLGQISVG
ncbi:MAG: hypothetical protein F4X01_01655 [Nitrospira sp. SB0661_bin_20]|nr:hypothetical protein [Nitrospira sp. SB0661_bin_20]